MENWLKLGTKDELSLCVAAILLIYNEINLINMANVPTTTKTTNSYMIKWRRQRHNRTDSYTCVCVNGNFEVNWFVPFVQTFCWFLWSGSSVRYERLREMLLAAAAAATIKIVSFVCWLFNALLDCSVLCMRCNISRSQFKRARMSFHSQINNVLWARISNIFRLISLLVQSDNLFFCCLFVSINYLIGGNYFEMACLLLFRIKTFLLIVNKIISTHFDA